MSHVKGSQQHSMLLLLALQHLVDCRCLLLTEPGHGHQQLEPTLTCPQKLRMVQSLTPATAAAVLLLLPPDPQQLVYRSVMTDRSSADMSTASDNVSTYRGANGQCMSSSP